MNSAITTKNKNLSILIVDDEKRIRDDLDYLLSENFTVFTSNCVSDALDQIEKNSPDIVLTDIFMPKESGLLLCRKIRENQKYDTTSVVAMSGIADEIIRTQCFNEGFDDFIEKPFSPEEIEARVRSKVVRRVPRVKEAPKQELLASYDCFKINYMKQAVYLNEVKLDLSNVEYRLLLFLLTNKDKIVRREEVLQEVWPDCHVGARTVDAHVCKLREKIKNQKANIVTLRGLGYRLQVG